jgi:hypothetical protein
MRLPGSSISVPGDLELGMKTTYDWRRTVGRVVLTVKSVGDPLTRPMVHNVCTCSTVLGRTFNADAGRMPGPTANLAVAIGTSKCSLCYFA